ncbi:hypothetical protein L3Q82_003549 [Scortum barcoo]|uniref:Uncharacterized protein n=1 Tax=Scortum barcoo TaxID=214431 RepID=A0ACB8VPT5_9TELE|nr:hypothetical protein L3Q82_003549 [Scortum barcoo]
MIPRSEAAKQSRRRLALSSSNRYLTRDAVTFPDYDILQDSDSAPVLKVDVTMRRIDLSGNLISQIDEGAFSKLPNLEELYLAENRLTKLPTLPTKLVTFNANFNMLTTQGVKATAFKNNKIKTITDETFCKGNTSYYIRTNMDEVRLDGNPVKLSKHPYSFICLQSLPIGWYN